jgi:Carboxypeptidase regulatory-like domain/TonB dependent receptor
VLGRPTPLGGVFLVLASLATSVPALASAQTPIPPVQPLPRPPAGPGRVVATISVLEGTVRMPGVEVELKTADEKMTLAKTMTDGAGQVSFPDVPPGRYFVSATRPGFVSQDSAQFDVRSGETAQVLLDINLAFTVPPVEVRASSPVDLPEPAPPLEPLPEPIESLTLQPVSASDMLSGSLLDVAPLEGDDFQSLLPLLPGVVRGADGRLRIKGGHPTQGALQISSASLIDPSSGDFDLDLPGQSVESVEVLANPFAAEYGRFSTSITQIRTRRGTNEWEIKPGNLVPRFRKGLTRIRGFEPRFSVRGPLKRDRLFLAQDFQYRYVANPVKSLPDEPVVKLISVDSFTRVDSVLSTRHTVGGGVIVFPREIGNVTMDTFRPPEVAPDFHQTGASVGVVDRFGLTPDIVLESTFSGRWFEIDVNTDGRTPMTYAPETQSGLFFNDQEREVHSVQLVEALSISRDLRGEHVFKFGFDLQNSGYSGTSDSRTIEVRRLDESLAELTVFGGPTTQVVNGTELAVFAQDRWRVGPRLSLELGIRMDRDAIVERTNWSPRGGVSIGVMPDGRAILRGGVGKFTQRTPLNVGAFTSFETPVVSRFAADGAALGPPVAFTHVTDSELRTPEAIVGNVEWDQRFGRRFLLKVEYLRRHGSHEYLLERDPAAGTIRLSSTGTSRYWEAEATVRYLGGESRDVTVSYVRSNGTADLNNYDQFYGNLRNPILRANENNLIPTDVPHRVIARGTFGLPGKLLFAPVVEVRSGFPFSAVDEFQDFVGPRSRAGRLPTVATLDFQLSRNWRFKKYRFRAGIKMYNVFGVSADRDVQNNLTSPNYGTFYNPIERSVGFVFGSAR